MIKFLLVVVVYLAIDSRVDSSQEVVHKFTLNFGNALEICKKEQNLPDSIDSDFMNYWNEDFVVTNRDTGCAVHCLATKLDLITDDKSLHHGNTHEFAKTHGADDKMAQQLVDIIHGCEKLAPADIDDCWKMVGMANCFKAEIKKLDWVPDRELLMGEVLAEV